jgi:elongation factor Ts
VKQAVEKAGKELGLPVKITGFVRFALGEGIDKEQSDAA